MPWIGYFSMIDKVDVFVFLDDVQLVKRSWQVRNKIKSNGKELLLTIPIVKDKKRNDMLIQNSSYCKKENWKEKHLKSINHSYSKAKCYYEVYPFIEKIYWKNHASIAQFNIDIIKRICEKIGITSRLIVSSNINKNKGKKDELLANICESINVRRFLSAQGAVPYIEENNPGGEFTERKIELYYHMYNHPIYPQLGNDFISHMGIFDLLFNTGFDHALEIIRSGNEKDLFYLDYRDLFLQNARGNM
ncbi:WbqC family protein [Neobacillus niacini]|uniref:WbqC family protein n=1 Tax=Neobacillus niacini TaxID=86668 RepID=UPI002379A892|nr:WbqC family protein [Neobacillus niacini]